ncbi:hypothetical protein OF83DRAFT_1089500 [Amylostereum chailletii]|nr:hypothetical protein OF83DRAFT_1089500 [Amylostereum chailletii]
MSVAVPVLPVRLREDEGAGDACELDHGKEVKRRLRKGAWRAGWGVGAAYWCYGSVLHGQGYENAREGTHTDIYAATGGRNDNERLPGFLQRVVVNDMRVHASVRTVLCLHVGVGGECRGAPWGEVRDREGRARARRRLHGVGVGQGVRVADGLGSGEGLGTRGVRAGCVGVTLGTSYLKLTWVPNFVAVQEPSEHSDNDSVGTRSSLIPQLATFKTLVILRRPNN